MRSETGGRPLVHGSIRQLRAYSMLIVFTAMTPSVGSTLTSAHTDTSPLLLASSTDVPSVPRASTRAAPATGPYVMFPHPSSVLRILENVKFALEHDFLLREDFYTDDNLKAFFGGTRIVWPLWSATTRSALISGFDQIVPPLRDGSNLIPGIDLSAARWVQPDGKLRARIAVTVKRPAVTFEQIENLFGMQWQDYPDVPAPPHKQFRPPTHPKGNNRIRYAIDRNGVSTSVTIEFAADGSLREADFSEERR